MKKHWKAILLVIAALIVLALIFALSIRIYHNAQGFHLPGPEDRQMGEPNIHSWMTVEEVASKYETTPDAVFQAFNITPEAGDERLSLRKLKEKYGKTREEMQAGLDQIITSSGPPPGPDTDAPKEITPEKWDESAPDKGQEKRP